MWLNSSSGCSMNESGSWSAGTLKPISSMLLGNCVPTPTWKKVNLLKGQCHMGGVGGFNSLVGALDKVEVSPGTVPQGIHQFVIAMQIKVAHPQLEDDALINCVGQLHG